MPLRGHLNRLRRRRRHLHVVAARPQSHQHRVSQRHVVFDHQNLFAAHGASPCTFFWTPRSSPSSSSPVAVGRERTRVAPPPGVLRASRVPFMASAKPWATAKPNPSPFWLAD
ncbi:hypothetical protein [Corynebacterium macclintockiae]|uniref:hypothetical protein n=1 Tax=Corynebacterium macclintockiae TaxID=2913501 RepID=UPI003EC02ECF